MERINHVVSFGSYNAVVGCGIADDIGRVISEMCGLGGAKVCIVTDTNCDALFSDRIGRSLSHAGFEPWFSVFAAGESMKSADNYFRLLSELSAHSMSRSDVVVALGGGTVGDLSGFAASTYMRGVPLVMIPTTLLSCVDASVGGKNAIDMPCAKNIAGTIYSPAAVVCDTSLLRSLPLCEVRNGFAEIIKYSIIAGGRLFSAICGGKCTLAPEDLLATCLEIKAGFVLRDEKDGSVRRILNLGHTAAHAIETLSGYTIAHGEAVAKGIAIDVRASAGMGLIRGEDADTVLNMIASYGLDPLCQFDAQSLSDAAMLDKKRSGDTIAVPVIRGIGNCAVINMDFSRLSDYFAAGLG